MPLPLHLKDSAAVLDNVLKTVKNTYVVGIGGVISVLVEVRYPHARHTQGVVKSLIIPP